MVPSFVGAGAEMSPASTDRWGIDPIEPPREPPVGLADEVHEGGHQHRPDDEGVDDDGARQADAELLDDDASTEHK